MGELLEDGKGETFASVYAHRRGARAVQAGKGGARESGPPGWNHAASFDAKPLFGCPGPSCAFTQERTKMRVLHEKE